MVGGRVRRRSSLKVMGSPPPFLYPGISLHPQPGHTGGRPHLGAGVEVWTVRDAAWQGAALAVPSSWDAVDPLGTLQQDTQPRSNPGRLLVPPS